MDNIPFRVSGSSNRGRNEDNEVEPTVEQPVERPHRAPVHHPAPKKSNKNKLYATVAAIVLAIVVIALGVFFLVPKDNTASAIDGGKFQAVFFTNGQVYFGKLSSLNTGYFKLTNIFYLQAAATDTPTVDKKNPQQTNSDANSNVTLIKLGNEIHGPNDEMVISKDQVLFFENLKADGKVSTSIGKYQNPK